MTGVPLRRLIIWSVRGKHCSGFQVSSEKENVQPSVIDCDRSENWKRQQEEVAISR